MTPPPRPGTPITIPPLDLVRRVEAWKVLAGVAVGLVSTGIWAMATWSSKADVGALEQVRAGAAKQLYDLNGQVQDMRTTQARIDERLMGLSDQINKVGSRVDDLYPLLVDIARVTGARRTPAPAATARPVTRPP